MATQVGSYKKDWTAHRIGEGVLRHVEESLSPGYAGRYAGTFSAQHFVPATGGFSRINGELGDNSRELFVLFEVQAEADAGDGVKARLQVHLHKDPASSVREDDPFIVEVSRLLGVPVDIEGWREWRSIVSQVNRKTEPAQVEAFFDSAIAPFLEETVPIRLAPTAKVKSPSAGAAPAAATRTTPTTGSRQGQRWSHDEFDALVSEVRQGKTSSEIAALHGRSVGAINSAAFNLLRPDLQPDELTRAVPALAQALSSEPQYDWIGTQRHNKNGAAPAAQVRPAAVATTATGAAGQTVANRVFLASKIAGYAKAKMVRHSIRTKLGAFEFEVYVAEADMIGGFQQSHIDRMIETSAHFVAVIWDSVGPATLAEIELAMRAARQGGHPLLHIFLSTHPDHVAARDAPTKAFLDEMDRQRLYAHFFTGDKELIDAVTNLFIDLSLD